MKTVKKKILSILLLCSCFVACADQPVGYLETSAARYDPDYIDIRKCPLFITENPDKGWGLKDFWPNYNEYQSSPDWEEKYMETWDGYLSEYTNNYDRYTKPGEVPWITPALQCILGTQPIIVSIHDVTSPDGGDVETFKKLASMYGNGVMILSTEIPAGTYMVSVKVTNEGHSSIVKDAMRVTMSGHELPPEPEPES